MKRRLQIAITEDAMSIVDGVVKEANDGFELGAVSVSDVVNEMILLAKIDLKTLQAKHTDLRKTLKVMATKDNLDIDLAIKSLQELKAKAASRRTAKLTLANEEVGS